MVKTMELKHFYYNDLRVAEANSVSMDICFIELAHKLLTKPAKLNTVTLLGFPCSSVLFHISSHYLSQFSWYLLFSGKISTGNILTNCYFCEGVYQ